jgi:Ca2+-binding RTX toxin-like protein
MRRAGPADSARVSAVSVTTGEDRVEITNLATDIDGLVGEDALILDYTGRYDGKAVELLELVQRVFASRMMVRISGNPSVLEDVSSPSATSRQSTSPARTTSGCGLSEARATIPSAAALWTIPSRPAAAHLVVARDGWDSIRLEGVGGVDTVDARAGNDRIFGAALQDVLDGGDGIDELGWRLTTSTSPRSGPTCM